MSVTTRTVKAAPAKVWDVLCDGWLYPLWVVGSTRMRDVDNTWPQVGSKLHHSAGVWPLMVDDNTEVLDVDPGRCLRLRARGWPLGEAEVKITLRPSGADAIVEIEEDVVSGPVRFLPKPARDRMLKVRNVEALRRLAFIAECRTTD